MTETGTFIFGFLDLYCRSVLPSAHLHLHVAPVLFQAGTSGGSGARTD